MGTTVRDNPAQSRYEIVVDQQVAGHSSYELDGDRIVFTHTKVDEAHRGEGVGEQLVTGLLEDVQRRGLEVVPRCSYVRKVIAEGAAEYLHLVPDDVRESLGL